MDIFNLAVLQIMIYTAKGLTATKTFQNNEFNNYSYFERAVNSLYFVDKTMLIEKFYNGGTPELITGPEGFGKSTNLDMVRRFFQAPFDETTGQIIDRKTSRYYRLFTYKTFKLRIVQEKNFMEKHCGAHPVIYLNFDNIQGTTTEQIMNSTLQKITTLIQSYKWLYDMDKNQAENSTTRLQLKKTTKQEIYTNTPDEYDDVIKTIEKLAQLLPKHFRSKLVVLIDNYDNPTMHTITMGEDARKVDNFMHRLLSIFVKPGGISCEVMIAGTSRLFKEKEGSEEINSINYNYFLENGNMLGKYFGFTDREVDRLLAQRKADDNERIKIKEYFNGYEVENLEQYISLPIFSPKCVLHYLETNTIDEDCIPTSSLIPKIFNCCLSHEELFDKIAYLLDRNATTPEVDLHMSKDDLDRFVDMVKNNCSTIDTYTPFETILIDSGFFGGYSKGFANKIMQNKFKKHFRNYYRENYAINITHSEVPASLQQIASCNITSKKMLNNLAASLQHLLEPKRDSGFTKFQFQSILFSTYINSFPEYHLTIQIMRVGESIYENPDIVTLKIPNYLEKILFVAKITFNETLQDAINAASVHIPYQSQNTSDFSLIKYIGINMNGKYQVEVGMGENREFSNVNLTIAHSDRDESTK